MFRSHLSSMSRLRAKEFSKHSTLRAPGTIIKWVVSEDGSELLKKGEVTQIGQDGNRLAPPHQDIAASSTERFAGGRVSLLDSTDDLLDMAKFKDEMSEKSSASACNFGFHCEDTIATSAAALQDNVSYPCSYCEICFTAMQYLEKHVKRTHRKQYLEMLRSRAVNLKKPSFKPNSPHEDDVSQSHIDTPDANEMATDSDPFSYQCTDCDLTFSVLEDLKVHQLSHNPGETLYLCSECGKSFSSLGSLQTHQKVHDSEATLYLCSECGDSFHRLDLLNDHQLTHAGAVAISLTNSGGIAAASMGPGTGPITEAQYPCPRCNKVFKTARYLRTHQKIHTGEAPYHCTECDKPFTQLGDLKTHQRTHTGERPYKCTECGKSFGRSGTLKKHWRTHTGETPYQCTVCGKSFNQLGALKTHHRIHTGEMPYHCQQCDRHFTYSYQLKSHACKI
ncbi:zinc finger protein OZF-like isoform X2 [Polypterus senegalus]|uniref:zinc finger protein OZF-like isoform X2 n=1 Tax=Polypterus senegalus TaxID=55291 RepID=UPI0019631647|nr:zinc finger protein OZF-like isoform X2 [Polypterus senegalus]XP_039632194.1 zinc finger protein OZF-like isoform X2 [Polypterus senegalus]XP_039632195.1 zinc finger protein OZF-like isoform X2 [Polypterus senegalus]